ncbi:MAG: AAA family ATPase [Gammaproteobacteria bacterium]|nr:AAA family ATPase [Gammaproteobacteria bacterium]
MTVHITARLAWHDDGWNGRVCKKPECNSYCTGRQSYPGDVIARERKLHIERPNAGKPLTELSDLNLPPCVYSINAFGPDSIKGYSNPPDFFREGARRTEWDIPPSTVCVWPYEDMYGENVYDESGRLNNDQRSANADETFGKLENNKSLIFYYANYSNPFSEEDSLRYVLIGVSRIKEVGNRLVYDGVSDYIREHFAGGMIWARNISSHYPEEGLRLPYHRYRDDPETLARFAVFPENPRTCKYGGRLISDDDAIGILEQILSSIHELRNIRDDSENWDERERWILGHVADLWSKRGLYPGLLAVMRLLRADRAIAPARKLAEAGKSKEAHELFFSAIDKQIETTELGLTDKELEKIIRQWKLKPEPVRALLRDILCRIDLDLVQIERIVSEDIDQRETHGLQNDVAELIENPYLLCECYVGDNPDDTIPWSTVDRGVLPSPELGGEHLAGMEFNDARRLRALCVEQLKCEPNQTFRAADSVLSEVNARIAKLPDWKSKPFTERYFEVDRDTLEQTLMLRLEDNRLWLYLRRVFNDERDIEDELAKLASRPELALNRPFTKQDWCDVILERKSNLFFKAKETYMEIVAEQASLCETIFKRPLAVITGAAGTGKTTVICAIIHAVRQTEGDGVPITVMAPTGKASDRVRAKLHERDIERVDISTIHSFLAKAGWLNKNLTFKQSGGKLAANGTIIVDEGSMLDVGLMASLVRAVEWRQVRRFILVGDPNQLPPIGRGRVFADVIEWLSSKQLNSIARLNKNLRQMENEVEKKGTAIPQLANLFAIADAKNCSQATSSKAEKLLTQIHKGGDVDADLRVIYWDDPPNLADQLIRSIENEMETHTNLAPDPDKPYDLWRRAFEQGPEHYQVLTPHRAELHGVEALNEAVQNRIARGLINSYGSLDGITLFDKVIQYRNRPQSNAISAYNFKTRKSERVEIFNGEIGFVEKHGYDRNQKRRRLKRFQVKFARKDHLAVGYGQDLPSSGNRSVNENVEENLELAYAISIHKAQGSEFNHTYVLVPKSTGRMLSSELIYTALTRATEHCTLFIQGDVSTLLSARRPENAQLSLINSSLFDGFFRAVPDELIRRKDWYEEGKIHKALTGDMVRSKSEVIIANLLHDRNIPFEYETLLKAPDGTMYLPDFSVTWNGELWFWEHWGMMSSECYEKHRAIKVDWYRKHFPGRLLETFESKTLSQDAVDLITANFAG